MLKMGISIISCYHSPQIQYMNFIYSLVEIYYILFSELNYRDLSGFYKKSEAGGGPPTNEGECL